MTNPYLGFKRFIPGEVNVRRDGYVMRKDNRKGHDGEWIYSYGRPDPSGHYYVDYLGVKYYVHKMVAGLFVPVPADLSSRDDLVVHHRDEDKSNNSEENLEWLGFGEHSSLHKTGELNHNAKLTNEEVITIRKSGHRPVPALAKQYGVSEQTIYRIRSGKGWQIDDT